MSIKKKQIEKATNKVLAEELQAGRFPEASYVEKRIKRLFKDRQAGLPRFTYKPVESHSLSDPNAYNETFQAVDEDLAIAFEEVTKHHNEMMAIANLYETEKQIIEKSLRRLDNRIGELSERSDYKGYCQIISDTFQDFNQLEFEGDEEKGIPATNAFIELRQGIVTLEHHDMNATKHDLSKANTKIVTVYEDESLKPKTEELYPIDNALKDTINESWEFLVNSHYSVKRSEIRVSLSLPQSVEGNVLIFESHSPKETYVSAKVSSDGEKWKPLREQYVSKYAEWIFDEEIKFIEFTLRKEEPDWEENTSNYFQFGARKIILKKQSYVQQGTLVSKAYPITNPVMDEILLHTDDVVMSQSDIHYYVGTEEGGSIQWEEVVPNQPMRLHRLKEEQFTVNRETEYYQTNRAEQFGLSFYSIGRIPYTPVAGKTKVYLGDYMWKVESKEGVDLLPEHIPSLSDWKEVKGSRISYLPIEKTYGTEQYTLPAKSLQRFTTHVYCEKEEEIYNLDFHMGEAYIKVYLNSNLLQPAITRDEEVERYKYQYRFQKGWNKIEILTYSETENPFKPNLYLKEISTKVLAEREPLREISYYDLLNNTTKWDYLFFALDHEYIMINYDPIEMDETKAGIRYIVEYEHLPVEVPDITQIRFMAMLSRNASHLYATPILKRYRLLLK